MTAPAHTRINTSFSRWKIHEKVDIYPNKDNFIKWSKDWKSTINLLTGVSKCVTEDVDIAGGAGLGLIPQALTVCFMSWGLNPPSHLSLGTLRYLQRQKGIEWDLHVCIKVVFLFALWRQLPFCQKLILLSIQTELIGFICSVWLSHTLWGVNVSIVTKVAVVKEKKKSFSATTKCFSLLKLYILQENGCSKFLKNVQSHMKMQYIREKKHSNAGFWAEAMSLAKNAIKMF